MPTRAATSRSRISGVSARHRRTCAWLVRNVQVFASLLLDIRCQNHVLILVYWVSRLSNRVNLSRHQERAMENNGIFAQVNDSIRRSASDGPATQTWEFICECQ